jgi:hypothetical protein
MDRSIQPGCGWLNHPYAAQGVHKRERTLITDFGGSASLGRASLRNNNRTAGQDLVQPDARKFRARSPTACAIHMRSSRPIDGAGCGQPHTGMRR